MGSRVLLSAVLLSFCLMMNVFGNGVDDNVNWTQAPHHAPSYQPVAAPGPHHHHHHHIPGVGHHHKLATPPMAHTPTKAPVHAPVQPPTKAPVQPPTNAPVHHHHKPGVGHHHKLATPPMAHTPTQAPVHAPVQTPTKAPVQPPTKAPVHHHHKPGVGHHHKLATPPMAHTPTQAPVHAPVQTPTKAPVQPPTKAPVHPPSSSPAPFLAPIPSRKLVAVQGVVYCKACKYKGVDTLLGATPLPGAEVLLTCNNTKYPLRVKGTTDKNGYFFIKPTKALTTYGSHTCRVSLLTSPMATCSEPTDLHAGVKGSLLLPNKKPPLSSPDAHPLPYDVFSVGPFAFEPSSKTPCAKETIED